MRIIPLFFTALMASNSFANDSLSVSQDEFYAVKENQALYETLSNSGQIQQSREQFKAVCLQEAKTDKELAHCKCAATELDKIDDKAFVYDSVISYRSFQAKVEAKNNQDEAEYQKLVAFDKNRDGIQKSIESVCGKAE